MSINEDGDPAIGWNEQNTADDDGQAVIDAERAAREQEADRQHAQEVAAVTREWAQTLGDARMTVVKAQRLQSQLANLDYDFDESSLNNDARRNLNDAWRLLDSVMTIADGLLRPIVDAEKAAEIERLRAEVGQLQRQLADRDRPKTYVSPCADEGEHEPCGRPELCDCVCHAARWHALDVAAGAPAERVPDPIDGQGSDLD